MTRNTISNHKSTTTAAETIKFLYSYGGKILPRPTDGKLRYVGGHTRVLAVDRSIKFAEIIVRFGELCGSSVSFRCKLPSEDLDVLVSVKSDEDLANVLDEYDRFSSSTHKDLKITAVLFPLKSLKKISPVSSHDDLCSAYTGSSGYSSATTSSSYSVTGFRYAPPLVAKSPCRCRNLLPPSGFPGDSWCRRCCEQRNMPRHLYRCCEQGKPINTYVAPQWNRCP